MDIRLVEGQYKSISALEWKNIPKFAIITGANGSGKTQLLELIARSAGVYAMPQGVIARNHTPDAFNARLECSEVLDSQNTVLLRSYWDIADSVGSIQEVYAQIDEAWHAQQKLPGDSGNIQWDLLWDALVHVTNISRGQFTREQFDAALPANFVLMKEGATRPAIMQTAIPLLFVSYAKKLHYLEQEKFSKEEIDRQIGVLPWDAVNNVLQQAGLDYRMEAPIVKEGLHKSPTDVLAR